MIVIGWFQRIMNLLNLDFNVNYPQAKDLWALDVE